MKEFHPLEVVRKSNETQDSVRIALAVPEALKETYAFLPGQHLPIRLERDGRRLRRTYSICSAPGEWPLEIGVRVQPGGQFSGFVAERLEVGDPLEVMPPSGQFHVELDPSHEKDYLAFAAGSGITPIIAILRSILAGEPGSRVALFYGNRRQSTTMFIDDLYALKNRYPERLQLNFVFSREEQEFGVSAGRLDCDKVRELYRHFCRGLEPSQAFVCGPDTMIDEVTAALVELGMDASGVHAERFGVPRKSAQRHPAAVAGDGAAVTIVMDGHRKSFDMPRDADNIVDAAAVQGIDLPYSCKGGVCATCRTHLAKGEVVMDVNYALEPWEVEAGFILACQSKPVSDEVVLDYDKT